MQKVDVCESTKADSIKMTMCWLKENYEYAEGVSIPRKVLYENYIRCCSKCNVIPISSATFGKIIRQQFPQITTRRLGTRGQSKYHYHGMAVKISSSDFDPAFAKSISIDMDLHSVIVSHPKNRNESTPTVNISIPQDENLTDDENKPDLKHFLVMYQTHSQQMLDSIIQGCFDEVAKFLSSFWRGCPDNFKYLFNDPNLISCVIFLDIQVYLSVSYSVLPSMDQILPENYLKDFIIFLCNISSILTSEISDSNFKLKSKKLKYAVLFKQLSLTWLKASHMLQIIYPIFQDMDIISQILEDFQVVVLDDVICRVALAMPESERLQFSEHFQSHFEDLENILERNFSVDDIMCWCQMIYREEWIKDHRSLFLGWSSFLSTFLKDLFLQRSSSFAHVHVIFMWLEHLLYTQCTLAHFRNFRINSEDLDEYESTAQCHISKTNNIHSDLDIIKFIPRWYGPGVVNNIPEVHKVCYYDNVVESSYISSAMDYSMDEMDPNTGYRDSILEENIKILWNL